MGLRFTRSQKILVGSAIGVFTFAGIIVGIGFVVQERIQSMAGPLRVWAFNESEEKLRFDLVVGQNFGTLELEPGRSGMVRFDPGEEGQVARLILFRQMDQLLEVRTETITREDPVPVVFRVLGPREVLVTRGEP